MSERSGDTFVVRPTGPQTCELCGKAAELRPYGPRGESICFDCGMANRETTDAAFASRIAGVTVVIVDDPQGRPS